MKKKMLFLFLLLLGFQTAMASQVISFETMYGVDGPFVGGTEIRNVLGDELPWVISSSKGYLLTDGTLHINVKGLVFSNDPVVPPELRGINDEKEFRGLVSCITEENEKISMTKIFTKGYAATRSGNSVIHEKLTLPSSCIAPVIFVMAGSEEKWFAVTGAELEPKR